MTDSIVGEDFHSPMKVLVATAILAVTGHTAKQMTDERAGIVLIKKLDYITVNNKHDNVHLILAN